MNETTYIYLDIDGVLIYKNKQTEYLDEFIKYLSNNYRNIFWLTTHCQGSTDNVMEYLKHYVSRSDTYEIMTEFLPTTWDVMKTDGINFNTPFIWFDDTLLNAEKEVLISHKKLDNFVKVNLLDNPKSLLQYTYDFPISIE